jgi:hypothetical protein
VVDLERLKNIAVNTASEELDKLSEREKLLKQFRRPRYQEGLHRFNKDLLMLIIPENERVVIAKILFRYFWSSSK